ncbi:MAG: RNA-binding S4 domain-containing protein [Immundisolibacter sp.]
MKKNSVADDVAIRLDKWLWVSRLYRTRTLATQAVSGGKVRVNRQPAKPARVLRLGDEISLHRGDESITVVMRGSVGQRVPAKAVSALYEETADSIAARLAARERHALTGWSGFAGKGRPTKRDRRALDNLTKP